MTTLVDLHRAKIALIKAARAYTEAREAFNIDAGKSNDIALALADAALDDAAIKFAEVKAARKAGK